MTTQQLNPAQFFADYGNSECCIFDGNRGIYITPAVIKLAMSYGFTDDDIKPEMSDTDILNYEFSNEVEDEAESYLNEHMPQGYYVGRFEAGDWGIFKCEQDESDDESLATFVLPSHWASALINNDRSGMTIEDENELNKFLATVTEYSCLTCSDEPYFTHSNDAGTLACDVLEFTFRKVN